MNGPWRGWREEGVTGLEESPSAVGDLPAATQPSWPLVLCWGGAGAPLPRRAIDGRGRPSEFGLEAPPWLPTGPVDRPFDFCGHMERLGADIARRCPALGHIDVGRLLFAVTQARSARKHGLQARVTPLRFRNGSLLREHDNVVYQVQRFLVDGREMLYVVTFCLPRFLELDFDEKLVTLFHELYHVSPSFDGDLRRHAGRCEVHSNSQQRYDRHMAALAREYLARQPDASLHAFLRLTFAQLHHRHGTVVGTAVPRPKLIPLVRRN